MGFGQAVAYCFKNYANFNGRAGRSEYWFFYLFNVLLVIAAILVIGIVGAITHAGILTGLLYLVFVVASLGLILPGIAVTIRRLHDTDHSGWWVWIALVPLLGVILLIVWYCTQGTSGPNKFGDDPLQTSPEGIKQTFA